MKKRSIAITVIIAMLLMIFSSVAVMAEGDDHGADAHSESMYQVEEDADYDNEMSITDGIIDTVTSFLPYIIGVICGIVGIVIIVKLIRRNRKPRYTGRH